MDCEIKIVFNICRLRLNEIENIEKFYSFNYVDSVFVCYEPFSANIFLSRGVRTGIVEKCTFLLYRASGTSVVGLLRIKKQNTHNIKISVGVAQRRCYTLSRASTG